MQVGVQSMTKSIYGAPRTLPSSLFQRGSTKFQNSAHLKLLLTVNN